jgi:ribonuclease R
MRDIIGTVGEVGGTAEGSSVVPFVGEDPVAIEERLPTGSIVAVTSSGVRVLAESGTALASVYRVAAQVGLRLAFAEGVVEEATSLGDGTNDDALTDLDDLAFVTIDYETSKDLDQAVFVEARDDGFVVYYALADASHFVRPGSDLFGEALVRGTSFYLPGLTVPMLPRHLCENIVSLNAGVARRALTFRMTLDHEGRVRESEIIRARIRSRAKLSYSGVQRYYDDPSAGTIKGQDYAASLDALAEVGRLRVALAEERDVVRYDRVSVDLCLSDDGGSLLMNARRRLPVERYNEQISLLCNMEGARILAGKTDGSTGLLGIFRVHPAPAPEKLEELEASISDLITALGLPAETWAWRRQEPSCESLADYIDRLPDNGEGGRLARALQRQAMLAGQASTFTLEPGPHYGIGAVAYSRFSAPMREMVGILTQHMALAQLGGQGSGLGIEIIQSAVDVANEAKLVQKRATKLANGLALDELFKRDLERGKEERPRRSGTVMGMTRGKIYVQLDDPPVDVKVYVEDLERRWGGRASLAKGDFEIVLGKLRFSVGACIALLTDEYDARRQRWLFDVS